MKPAGLYTSVRITRREFGAITGGLLASAAFSSACHVEGEAAAADDGRLTARPLDRVTTTESGQHPLGLAIGRDAVLHLPAKVPAGPMPLLVLLHGAGGSGERMLGRLGTASDDAGIAVLAPDSRGTTWDAIRSGFGRDVIYLN